MFLIAKTYKYSNILFYRCLDCARHDKVSLDMTRVMLDMTRVTLDMTWLAGSYPYERHTDEDERQIDSLGAEVPLLEDEGGACE